MTAALTRLARTYKELIADGFNPAYLSKISGFIDKHKNNNNNNNYYDYKNDEYNQNRAFGARRQTMVIIFYYIFGKDILREIFKYDDQDQVIIFGNITICRWCCDSSLYRWVNNVKYVDKIPYKRIIQQGCESNGHRYRKPINNLRKQARKNKWETALKLKTDIVNHLNILYKISNLNRKINQTKELIHILRKETNNKINYSNDPYVIEVSEYLEKTMTIFEEKEDNLDIHIIHIDDIYNKLLNMKYEVRYSKSIKYEKLINRPDLDQLYSDYLNCKIVSDQWNFNKLSNSYEEWDLPPKLVKIKKISDNSDESESDKSESDEPESDESESDESDSDESYSDESDLELPELKNILDGPRGIWDWSGLKTNPTIEITLKHTDTDIRIINNMISTNSYLTSAMISDIFRIIEYKNIQTIIDFAIYYNVMYHG
jgi:hypothetical protein